MVDFSKTRDQLKQRAALSLGVVEPGEPLSAEDNETFDDLIDPLIAQLAEDEIVYIADADAIELQYFLPLARLLANAAGPDFGSPINEEARRIDEATLRRMNSTRPTYEVQKGEYF